MEGSQCSLLGLSVLKPSAGYHTKSTPIYSLKISIPILQEPQQYTHVNWELSSHEDKLCRISRQLLDAADMSFKRVDSACPQLVYSFKVSRKHVGVLIILGRYILPDGFGH